MGFRRVPMGYIGADEPAAPAEDSPGTMRVYNPTASSLLWVALFAGAVWMAAEAKDPYWRGQAATTRRRRRRTVRRRRRR